MGKILLSLLCSRLNSLSSFSLSSCVRCFSLLIIFLAFWWTCSHMSFSLLLRSAELNLALQLCVTRDKLSRRIISLNLKQSRTLLDIFSARAYSWHIVSLLSTRTPRSLSAELLSGQLASSLYWCLGYSC